MHRLPSPADLRDWLPDAPRPLALVPTMGALHAGHLALIDRARQPDATPDGPARAVVVSIFVNPTQFAPHEDLDRYPRPLDNDLALLADRGVDAVFRPTADQLYPPGRPAVAIDVPDLARPLEGEHRPTHFAGVCRVCLKLFHLTQPDLAVFGEKDYQQLAVIRAMVADLDLPLRIVPCPTVREPDGLAMSSRNRYLNEQQRQHALGLSRALAAAQHAHAHGTTDPARLEALMHDTLADHRLVPDYAAVRHAHTLQPLAAPLRPDDTPARLLIAARCGDTRLIDNAGLTD
jgi:pantoate--beta-alanine ligase